MHGRNFTSNRRPKIYKEHDLDHKLITPQLRCVINTSGQQKEEAKQVCRNVLYFADQNVPPD